MQASLAQQLLQPRPTCDCQALQMPCLSPGRRTVASSREVTAGKQQFALKREGCTLLFIYSCHESLAM